MEVTIPLEFVLEETIYFRDNKELTGLRLQYMQVRLRIIVQWRI